MMRILSFCLILLMEFAPLSISQASGFRAEKFTKVIYLKGVTTGYGGTSYSNPKPIADGDLWDIPARTVIEKVYVIVDTVVAGTTVLEVGDDDDADGFVKDVSTGLGTAGMYGWSAKGAGDYLNVVTAGGTDAADIDTVPDAKYYAAAGKELKLNITTTNTAGEVRVIVEGYLLK